MQFVFGVKFVLRHGSAVSVIPRLAALAATSFEKSKGEDVDKRLVQQPVEENRALRLELRLRGRALLGEFRDGADIAGVRHQDIVGALVAQRLDHRAGDEAGCRHGIVAVPGGANIVAADPDDVEGVRRRPPLPPAGRGTRSPDQ